MWNTGEDGFVIGPLLAQLFQKLNQERLEDDNDFAAFPYINGNLFEDSLEIPVFDSKCRQILLDCCEFDWGKISPAVFGSLFQNISDPERRRTLGEHYTDENNILKVLNPLFLDHLRQELKKSNTKAQLEIFLTKLSGLKFLDPACGCGNFLVVAYRELRRIELAALGKLHKEDKTRYLDSQPLSRVNVDQFYGVEIAEFPAKIAQVALWLTDHQMNLELSAKFGGYRPRIPLTHSAKIVTDNALRIDWNTVVVARELHYIMGNPPFVGDYLKAEEQQNEVKALFQNVSGAGKLDYVTCWYKKATDYMKNNPSVISAFVSTNSITQGYQVTPLWTELLRNNVHIHFAHRTFAWNNEAENKAAVHCVIIGFALFDIPKKKLWDYFDPKAGEGICKEVSKINPYLLELDNILVTPRESPLSIRPVMTKGSQPTDGGHFFFTPEEKEDFLKDEPQAAKFIRPVLGAKEFIHNKPRYCLWLKDADLHEVRRLPKIRERIDKVKQFRLASSRKATVDAAAYPYLFSEIRQPASDYLLIPSVSSEQRTYIPIRYIDKNTIVTNAVFTVEHADLYLFGILTSMMHMTWIKYVCGRLKSDYRYSNTLGYNTFPFPMKSAQDSRDKISDAARRVLDIRQTYLDRGQNYADLYNPDLMPADLVKAHGDLDKATDRCYGFDCKETGSDAERIRFLFHLYFEQTESLLHQKIEG